MQQSPSILKKHIIQKKLSLFDIVTIFISYYEFRTVFNIFCLNTQNIVT